MLVRQDLLLSLRSKYMRLDKPLVIEDLYEWLPTEGEDSVRLEFDKDLDLIIGYFD